MGTGGQGQKLERRIIYAQRVFSLKMAIPLQLACDEGVWTFTYAPLALLGYGKTRSEAMNAFKMEFAAIWDEIVQEDDIRLTPDAIALKHSMLELVERVEPL